MRVCRCCGQLKPFVKGIWITVKGIPRGNECLSCRNANSKAYAKVNAAKVAAKNRKWYFEHLEYARAQSNERMLKWAKENPERCAATEANKRAAKLQRTPEWVDYAKIAEQYELAASLTKETGIKHEVDHVVPLQGANVSGLHVHYNLQILTKSENSSKGNNYEH
jgi:hypothetical protein